MKSVFFLLKRHLQFNMLYLLNITQAGSIYCYLLGKQQHERQQDYSQSVSLETFDIKNKIQRQKRDVVLRG